MELIYEEDNLEIVEIFSDISGLISQKVTASI